MRFGVTFPFVEARVAAELGREAEEAGWHGVFVWDCILTVDPWVTMAAIAMRTERVCLGPIVTPLSRRRPWKLACESATLDRLSNGRLILPVGLGSDDDHWERLGEETSRSVRAKRLDEGLDVLTGLWSGQPFSYAGQQYRVTDATGLCPAQSPRVPIWVVGGRWPNPELPGSKLRRMLRWDGVLMNRQADVRAFRTLVEERRAETTPFDVVVEGETPGDDAGTAASTVRPLAEAGVTWWLESMWGAPWESGGVEGMRARIRQGPPRVG
jgi:hypothetical protein